MTIREGFRWRHVTPSKKLVGNLLLRATTGVVALVVNVLNQ